MNTTESEITKNSEDRLTKPWVVGVALATLAAWVAINFPPYQSELPTELLSVDMYSPPELQKQKALLTPIVLWTNCTVKFVLVGLSLGSIPAVCLGTATRSRRGWLVLAGMLSGLFFGFVAAQAGYYLRPNFSTGLISVKISDPIVRDTLFYAMISVILGMPMAIVFAIAQPEHKSQKFIAVLLACGLTGMLVPIAASPFPKMLTQNFPPKGLGLTGLWFGLLSISCIALPTMLGKKRHAEGSSLNPSHKSSPHVAVELEDMAE